MTGTNSNPRDIAVEALRDRAGNVSAHLERLLEGAELGPSDRALARELALGAVRRRGTLDAVLRAFLDQPDRPLPNPLPAILQVGLYQILFLDRVPDFAAVNEAVQQAARLRHKRQSGLVNGVLRTVVRELSPPDPSGPRFAPNAIPVSGTVFRTTARAVFSDPQAEPAKYLSEAFSLPADLARRWLSRSGDLHKAAELALHANTRAPLILRVNRLKRDLAAAAAALAAQGVEALPHANGSSLVLRESVNVRALEAFREGAVTPQDPTATAVVEAAKPRSGMRVLDFCAAPGTKTVHLAEMMGNEGQITAVDVSPPKLAKIEDNCRRMGIDIVETLLSEKLGGLDPKSFDMALVDVPCSNTGVLARRAEARWRFDERRLANLVRDQRALAAMAAEFVRPGGTVVFSTCSMEPEECDGVVKWLLEKRSDVKLIREQLTLPRGADDPSRWCDGGYFAILAVR